MKTERVIFVGMHNKPGKMPLCNSTKSGKLITRIVLGIEGTFAWQRTNLYDVEYYPLGGGEKHDLAADWHERVQPTPNDIIILLGAEVHKNFIPRLLTKIIKAAHPSSKRSHRDMNEYVSKTIEAITQFRKG